MHMTKSKKKGTKEELDVLNIYGSVDFFEMKKVFPLLVKRILHLENKLKTLQKREQRMEDMLGKDPESPASPKKSKKQSLK